MNNGLQIGKFILSRLTTDMTMQSYVGNKVYPLAAKADTDYPFIVYARLGIQVPTSTKDGYFGDVVTYQVKVASLRYEESIDIAQAVRGLLTFRGLEQGEFDIVDSRPTSISEQYDFDENAYIQTLVFQCEVR